MDRRTALSFGISPIAGEGTEVLSLTPALDGVPLTEIIAQFETQMGFEPVGGYGGLVPAFYRFGPMDQYFMSESKAETHGEGRIYLLGCTCCEVGCWPLKARISKTETGVVWTAFEQPHRKGRNYSGFGPFTFDIQQYREAVNAIASRFPEHQFQKGARPREGYLGLGIGRFSA